jgi:hypothetical protein
MIHGSVATFFVTLFLQFLNDLLFVVDVIVVLADLVVRSAECQSTVLGMTRAMARKTMLFQRRA